MSLAWLPMRLHDLLDSPSIDASRTAVVDGERAWTYAELRHAAQALAQRLRAAGVVRGDRVVLRLPKSLEECAALFAPSLAGAVVVPLNPVLTAEQVQHVVQDAEAAALVTTRALRDGLAAVLTACPQLRVLCVDEPADAAAEAAWPASAVPTIGQDLAAILYTSGSTGRPKGVMLSHANLVAGTRIVRTYLGIHGGDRILSVLPFSFDYGLNQLLTVVEQGAQIVLLNFQLGDQIVRALARHRITGLAGVPTVWALLTRAAPSLPRTPLPDLRYITNSGGAVPEPTVRRLRELLPTTQVFLMYGLTEAFRSTFLPPDEVDRRPGSIGKAIPECEVFIVDAQGRRAAPGVHGTLVHRGPTVSLGYWRRPEDTARVLRPLPSRPVEEGGDILCWSGDLAWADEEGFLYFVGRQDAMIKSAGHRISPSEVEDVVMRCGSFRQVAAIGLPDEWVGQRVHVVAVAADVPVATEAVLAEVARQLPRHMVPGAIELVDALPLTPHGKVDYRALVAQRSGAGAAAR